MDKLKILYPVIVEGKYDKIKLDSIIEANIIMTDGFGIFKKDGTLLYVLDTYIKTLPEADRVLLGEGIPIETKSQLYSLIEDYTE